MTEPKSEPSSLAQREFATSKEGTSPLKGEALARLQEELGGAWSVVGQHHLEKEFEFEDFRQALDFTNKLGELAERVGHHPDIHLSWGKVKVTIWTHTIDGLTENDFIFAARTDTLLQPG